MRDKTKLIEHIQQSIKEPYKSALVEEIKPSILNLYTKYTFILILFCLNYSFLTGQNETQEKQPSMKSKNWERPYFKEPLYEPFIFLVVYGKFDVDFRISHEKYKVTGIPTGIELMGYGPEVHPDVVKSFLEGYIWNEVNKQEPELASAIAKSPECFIIKGNVADTNNLNYFRNVIGLSSYLLDHGGVSVYDPQMLKFWSKSEWNTHVFEGNSPQPLKQVIILKSDQENGKSWIHTRGMLKFGRPDLSIHDVKKADEKAVLDLINRFIELQAFGGIIENGQEIRMKSLPEGMWCENKGDLEDSDFNNKHVEIHWK